MGRLSYLNLRDEDEVLFQSRDTKSLNRRFPELLDALHKLLPPRCVIDGEIVVARNRALDFDALQLRIHPAASRVKLLAQETPASIVVFDLLCWEMKICEGWIFRGVVVS